MKPSERSSRGSPATPPPQWCGHSPSPTSTRESSALRPSHHLAFSETQLTTFCSTKILSISCTSRLMGCCKHRDAESVNRARSERLVSLHLQAARINIGNVRGYGWWLPFCVFQRPHLLLRGRDVNGDWVGSLLKTCQDETVAHLPRFYSEHRHHTHRQP